MTDEIVKDEKECNCICCKILKSDCFKKFLMVLLASFIGCSLAILLFVPRPPKMPCYKFRHVRPMMERQLPPPYMHHRDFRGGEFKKMHRPPMGEFDRNGRPESFDRNGDFKNKPPRPQNIDKLKPVKELPQTENTVE